MSKRAVLALALFIAGASSLIACDWDVDTLTMERRRFPTVIELISGKFLRHSQEFYEWRIADRTAKIKTDPQRVEWYDDLAVAYSKLGDQKKAIEVILQKDKIKPGLYETEANLGTFLLFDGQWEDALKHVRRALEINPNAHFGREKYQAYLIEYVVPRLNDGKPNLPLENAIAAGERSPKSFQDFLRDKPGSQSLDRNEAIKALMGMMRFAEHRSPLLLEALGSLLIGHGHGGEQRLAARAYLKVSYLVTEPEVRQVYRRRAEAVMKSQENEPRGFEGVEADLLREIKEGDAWFADVRNAEIEWIGSGKDPEAEFLRRYPLEPETSTSLAEYLPAMPSGELLLYGILATLATTAFVVQRIRCRLLRKRAVVSPTS